MSRPTNLRAPQISFSAASNRNRKRAPASVPASCWRGPNGKWGPMGHSRGKPWGANGRRT
eukprot:991044-Lingulodinium_polyedra.AAC.1